MCRVGFVTLIRVALCCVVLRFVFCLFGVCGYGFGFCVLGFWVCCVVFAFGFFYFVVYGSGFGLCTFRLFLCVCDVCLFSWACVRGLGFVALRRVALCCVVFRVVGFWYVCFGFCINYLMFCVFVLDSELGGWGLWFRVRVFLLCLCVCERFFLLGFVS